MTISADDRTLVDFLGYGPTTPELVFLGYDEYCEIPAIATNLRARRTFPARHDKNVATNDLAAAFEVAGLLDQAHAFRSALGFGTEPTWTFAAMFSARFLDRGFSWKQEYEFLGTRGPEGRTFLTERYPLPRPSHRYDHPGRNARALTLERRATLKRELFAPLGPGVVVVSYAGRPSDVLGPMQRNGRRAWEPIQGSHRKKDFAEVARTRCHVALRVPFPRKGHEEWWEQWLDIAVETTKKRQAEILQTIK